MRNRYLLLAGLLALYAPPYAAAQSAEANRAADRLGAVLRIAPESWREPIADFLDRPDASALDLDASLNVGAFDDSKLPTIERPENRETASAASPWITRAGRKGGSVEAAAKLAELDRVLARHGATLAQRAPLIEGLRELRRGLSKYDRTQLVEATRRTIQALAGRAKSERPLDAVSAIDNGVRIAVPKPARLAPPVSGKLETLVDLSPEGIADAKREILDAAQEMYEEGLIEGRETLFPIPDNFFDKIVEHDAGFSQIFRDERGRVIGFALAYFDPQKGAVHIEKLGVLSEYRGSGLADRLVNAVARKAAAHRIPFVDLLVLKHNDRAIPFFERLAFENVVPQAMRDDPSADAFEFVAQTNRLLAATGDTMDARLAPPALPLGALEGQFAAAQPQSGAMAVLREYGFKFDEAAMGILDEYVFRHLPARPFEPWMSAPWFAGPRLTGALGEILDFAVSEDPAAKDFLKTVATHWARDRFPELRKQDFSRYEWPENPLKTGEYWDLATGPNGGRAMLAKLDPRSQYRFFDVSDFSIEYLREIERLARKAGKLKAKVSIEKADLRTMERPATPPAVIRAKNIHAYVSDGAKIVEKMADWIADGGMLLLQDGQDKRVPDLKSLGPMIERLAAKGWRFEYRFAEDPTDGFDNDSMMFYKPSKGASAAQLARQAELSKKAWENYKTRVVRSVGGFRGFPGFPGVLMFGGN